MRERTDERRSGGVEETGGRALDRRGRDGLAGAGDMLGGLSTGAGGDGSDTIQKESDSITGHQHDLERGEPRTDAGTTIYSADDLSLEGV